MYVRDELTQYLARRRFRARQGQLLFVRLPSSAPRPPSYTAAPPCRPPLASSLLSLERRTDIFVLSRSPSFHPFSFSSLILDPPSCSYLKIGACRHGERCSRKHIKPQYSQTLVILNAYQNPAHDRNSTSNPHLRPADAPPLNPNPESKLSEDETKEFFDKFCTFPSFFAPPSPFRSVPFFLRVLTTSLPGIADEDVYCELVKYGNLLEMHVCDNVGDHLIGNVYARFDWEDEAGKAVEELNKRWFNGVSGFYLSVLPPVRELEQRY